MVLLQAETSHAITTIAEQGWWGFVTSIIDFTYMLGMLVLSWLLLKWTGSPMGGMFKYFGWLKKIPKRYLVSLTGIAWWLFLTGVLRSAEGGIRLTEQIFITFWFTVSFHKLLLDWFLNKIGLGIGREAVVDKK